MKTFICLCLLCVVVAVLGTIISNARADDILDYMEASRDGEGINVIEYLDNHVEEEVNECRCQDQMMLIGCVEGDNG